jgi:caffeoyl-CoA O-methyltransferase
MARPWSLLVPCAFLVFFSTREIALAQTVPPGDPLLRVFDTDGNGVITVSEIETAAAGLRKLDANQDGRVTRDELPAHGPGGPGGGTPGLGRPEPTSSAFANPQLAKDDAERSILAALDLVRGGPRFANVPALDGRLLRLLTEAMGAKRVIEIGTSTGESAIWLALALRKTEGTLVTYEIDPERARIARENFRKAGVDDIVTLVLGNAHEEVKRLKDPVDMLFLDADKEGYLDYLDKLLPLVRPGGLVIAHNMNARMADPDFVKAITTNATLETAFLYMEHGGVSVTLKKR